MYVGNAKFRTSASLMEMTLGDGRAAGTYAEGKGCTRAIHLVN